MGKVNYGAKAAETQRRAQVQNAAASGQQAEPAGEKEYGSQPDGDAPKSKRSVSAANENTTQISFRIPMEYKRALKTYAAQHDTTINEVFREMLRNYLTAKGML